MHERLAANVDRFLGLAEVYDAARPAPPRAFADLLLRQAGLGAPDYVPRLVVDLGCGTGLSTRLWAGRAPRVLGIEPNAEMRAKAEARTRLLPDGASIAYQAGNSVATGLADGAADIVTCSQCLHWMEPGPTLREIARILRPGGVFAAIDCDWPPAVDWRVEAAYLAMKERADRLEAARGEIRAHRWPKARHLDNLRDSGLFVFVREVLLHGEEQGDAERMVRMALSQGGVAALLRLGVSEDELGLTGLRRVARQALGSGAVRYVFSYRVRLGVKG